MTQITTHADAFESLSGWSACVMDAPIGSSALASMSEDWLPIGLHPFAKRMRGWSIRAARGEITLNGQTIRVERVLLLNGSKGELFLAGLASTAKDAVGLVRRLRPVCGPLFLRRFDELAAAALGERDDFSI